MKNFKLGFTLIELLIVIGIVAVISIVVLLVLNPAELLRQARDSNRIVELASIDKALNLYVVDDPQAYLGELDTIYLSLPDDDPECDTYVALPDEPPGYTYACKSFADYRKADGNGWIPANFTNIDSGNPFSNLPVDPVNDAAQGLYYAYVPGGSWVMTAMLESQKALRESAATDAGTDPARVEIGSDVSLWVSASGLVGYWPFEGNANDASKNGFHGTPMGGLSSFPQGKVGSAASFDGTSNYVQIPSAAPLDALGDLGTNYTVTLWFKSSVKASQSLTEKWIGTYPWAFRGPFDPNGFVSFNLYDGTPQGNPGALADDADYADGEWHYAVGVRDSVADAVRLYVDGALKGEALDTTVGSIANVGAFPVGGRFLGGPNLLPFAGLIDEVRIYNRALTADEIGKTYGAQK